MKRYNLKYGTVFFGLAIIMTLGLLTGCSEDIDDSNFKIKDEPTMTDFLTEHDNLSQIKKIFDRVLLDNSDNAEEASASNASSITAVLSARGNYTLFAPNNDAVNAYLDSVAGTTDVDQITYEQAKLIAYSCLIDNGNNNAYESAEFPIQGTFSLANLNDRLLSSLQDETTSYIIGGSKVISADHEVSNGFVHIVNKVIAPSAESVSEMIQAADNMKIMAMLLNKTGLFEDLMESRDQDYEDDPTLPETRYWSSVAYYGSNHNWAIPQKRYLGFTGFVETDDVFVNDWGITQPQYGEDGELTNADQIYNEIANKVAAILGGSISDPTSVDDPMHKFVAYHFIKGKVAYNKFVHHFSEHRYSFGTNPLEPQAVNYTVDVWDYYATLPLGSSGYRGLIKVLQVPTGEHEIYLNRISKYSNGMVDGTYEELSTRANEPGQNGINIQVFENNGKFDNNAGNGFYYPIDHVLLYDATTRSALGSERMRVDITTMTPELLSNNFRGNCYQAFQNGYFEDIMNETEGTEIYYLQDGGSGSYGDWRDFQGDEYLFSGQYDFVLRLPPVPSSGTYEIRMGASNNSLRGMCQIYFGDSPDNTTTVGLPFDLRQNAGANVKEGTYTNPTIPFVADSYYEYDEDQMQENDKNLRIQGWMKAPKYFWTALGTQTARDCGSANEPSLRKIVTVQDLDYRKNYYLRFKSALKKTDSQFFVDYFEIVPRAIYNGTEPEDIW